MALQKKPCSCIYARMGESQRVRMYIYARLGDSHGVRMYTQCPSENLSGHIRVQGSARPYGCTLCPPK